MWPRRPLHEALDLLGGPISGARRERNDLLLPKGSRLQVPGPVVQLAITHKGCANVVAMSLV